MKLVKITIITMLTFTLAVGCSKSEEKKVNNQQEISQKVAEESQAKKIAQAEANKKAEAAKMTAQVEANKKAEAAKMVAQAEANKIAEAAKMVAQAETNKKAEAAKILAQAEANKKAEAAKMVAQAEANKKAEAAKMVAQAEANKKADEAIRAAQLKADEVLAQAEAAKLAAAKATALASQVKKETFIPTNTGPRTAVGALKGGNASGTIPAWTGGITKPPAGYKQGDHHQDPFSSDKILFTIDGSNYNEYADSLTVGQKAMFEKYSTTYKMNVYKTRRSASFPQRIYQKTIENGKTGELTGGGEGVANVAEGFPFPNASNAYEMMLNHKLKYKGSGGVRYNNQVAPTAAGRFTVVKLKEELLGKYYTEGNTVEDINNILLYFFQVVESPARLAGRILLVHETMNQTETPRQAWIYNPGQRRVRRAPNVAYDNPGTASDGLRTNDMTDMFNGAMDRFNWELVGTKEMYVPYNSYKVHSGDLDYADIVRPGHLNPDLMRYEIHRVHVVEATLKEGVRHINSKRTFYLDEDSYQIMLIDHYDKRGNIWRFSEAHCINYYDVPTFWSTIESHHDLRSGRYVAVGLDNKDPVNTFNVPLSEANYTPQALRKRGRR